MSETESGPGASSYQVMLHLLLIEDNPADVMMIREALRGSPIPADVIIAYDGEQALKLLEEAGSKSDFIILDLSIPKGDGHAFLERQKESSGPPIVVFTSSSNGEDRRRALANGASDYVIKPPGFNAFMQAVQEIVERWATGRPQAAKDTA